MDGNGEDGDRGGLGNRVGIGMEECRWEHTREMEMEIWDAGFPLPLPLPLVWAAFGCCPTPGRHAVSK